MRIAFFGNTNNYPLPLVLELRERGYKVDLYCDKSDDLHNPVNRDSSLENSDWIFNVSTLFKFGYSFFLPTLSRLKFYKKLKSYDFIFYNGMPTIIAWLIRVDYGVLITGSDLDVYGNLASLKLFSIKFLKENGLKLFIRQYFLYFIILSMRNSIRNAKFFNYFKKGFLPHGDKILDEIKPKSKIRTSFMIGNNKSIKYTPILDSSSNKLRVFCGARLNWVRPLKNNLTELDYKDVDKLLYGIKLFKERSNISISLCLVKKGVDIDETVALVKELALENEVIWFEEMSQSELYKQFIMSDVIVDQLGASAMGMVGVDALCFGRPVLTNIQEIESEAPSKDLPICVASNAEEVCHQLIRLQDLEYRKKIGEYSRVYADKNYSPQSIIDYYLSIIEG